MAQLIRFPFGHKANWEIGQDGTSLIEGERKEGTENGVALKSVSERGTIPITKTISTDLAVYTSVHQVLFTPTIGRCDIEIGPHIFVETKVLEVRYSEEVGGEHPLQVVTPTDIIIEFRENPSERYVLPLDCSIIERVLRLGVPPAILLSTTVPATPPNWSPVSNEVVPRHLFTMYFVQAGTPIWETMQKRVMSSRMPIQTVQDTLEQSVKTPIPRAFIALRLPSGPLLEEVLEASVDKLEPKLMETKEIRRVLPVREPPSKRKLAAANAPLTDYKPNNSTPVSRHRVQFAPPPILSKKEDIDSRKEGTSFYRDPEEPKEKKPYEKRVKVNCSTCAKAIARKAQDAGRDDYKPLCRNCAADARRAREVARINANPRFQQLPKTTVEVHVPPRVPFPAPTAAGPLYPGALQSAASSSTLSLFSSRPPPAPHRMPPSGLSAVPGVTYYRSLPNGPPGDSKPVPTTYTAIGSVPLTIASNPYSYYRPSVNNGVAPNVPAAHPYTGRYYSNTPEGQAWRPSLYGAPQYTVGPSRAARTGSAVQPIPSRAASVNSSTSNQPSGLQQ